MFHVKHSNECFTIYILAFKWMLVKRIQINSYKIILGSEKMYFKRLRDLREDKDLKQENIANILKITRQQYQIFMKQA